MSVLNYTTTIAAAKTVSEIQQLLATHGAARVMAKGITHAKANDRAHAERVAWRVVKDWLAAQLTLVAGGMASVDQVMLPYLRVDADRTLYQAYRDRENVLAIESGGDR